MLVAVLRICIFKEEKGHDGDLTQEARVLLLGSDYSTL